MKIISKHKDYYDSGLAYGIDEKLYFKRESIEYELNEKLSGYFVSYINNNIKYHIALFPGIMGFCGSIHPFYRAFITESGLGKTKKSNDIAYTLPELLLIFENMGCKVIMKNKIHGWKGNKKDVLFCNDKEVNINISSLEEFYDTGITGYGDSCTYTKQDYENIFREYNISYYVIETYKHEYKDYGSYGYKKDVWYTRLIMHPILKNYKFSKQKDAYTAFQEISMYLGNMNNPDDKIIKTDDKYLASSKGFCCHSFRKKSQKNETKSCSKKNEVE